MSFQFFFISSIEDSLSEIGNKPINTPVSNTSVAKSLERESDNVSLLIKSALHVFLFFPFLSSKKDNLF